MRELLNWSLAIPWRIRGIAVRIHLAYLVFMLFMIGNGVFNGYGWVAFCMEALLFISVLLHEFGHCFAARHVDGDATEILMWPLGGLAYVDVPNTPRANFITVIWGPAVNLMLCVAAAAALLPYGLVPRLDPRWNPIVLVTEDARDSDGKVVLDSDGKPKQKVIAVQADPIYSWQEDAWIPARRGDISRELSPVPLTLARLFWVNWILFWFNMLLVGFPMDAGRIVQCILWPRLGFRRATRIVCYAGFVTGLLAFYAFITMRDDGGSKLLLLGLAFFIVVTSWQQKMLLDAGMLGEDSLFGYDFSQGYTSLERDNPHSRRARPNFLQRWLRNRAARKRQREEQQRVADEQRMDELLAKVQRDGIDSLTAEERRFMNRQSARYRNRARD